MYESSLAWAVTGRFHIDKIAGMPAFWGLSLLPKPKPKPKPPPPQGASTQSQAVAPLPPFLLVA